MRILFVDLGNQTFLTHRVLSPQAEATIILLVKLIIILTYTPIFLLPAVFVATIGAYVGNIYIKAQLSIKREMSVTKAPILAVFGSAMTGLSALYVRHFRVYTS